MPDPLSSASRSSADAAGTNSTTVTAGSGTVRDAAAPASGPASAARSDGLPQRLLWMVAVLLAVGLLLIWLDSRRAQQALRTEVAERLAAIESNTQTNTKTQAQLANDLRDAQAKLALLEARLQESQAQQAALEALYRDLAPSRDEIALTEIEQVLLVASQQLQLAGNVQSGLAALQLADAKLQRLDRPQFLPLRRALAHDIDRLKALPYVDVTGLSLKLDQAIASVDSLPLAVDERLPVPTPPPPAVDEPGWQRLLREIWADVRQLVRIEVSDRPAAPLVAPSQQYFLRENLRLRLLSARIALLDRDDASLRSDTGAAEAWLKQYFDTRAKSVQAVQATLKQVAAARSTSELPDLVGSLEALRVLRLAQEHAQSGFSDRSAVPAADRRAR